MAATILALSHGTMYLPEASGGFAWKSYRGARGLALLPSLLGVVSVTFQRLGKSLCFEGGDITSIALVSLLG